METSLHWKKCPMETRYFDSEKKKCGLHCQKCPMETSLHCKKCLMETGLHCKKCPMETGLHQSFLFYLVSIEKKVWWRPVSIGHIFNGDQSPSQEMADGDRSPSAMETLNYKLILYMYCICIVYWIPGDHYVLRWVALGVFKYWLGYGYRSSWLQPKNC